jgi:hypothetical protein
MLEMENYNKVIDACNINGCKLLTTYEEFEKCRESVIKNYYAYVRIKFIGVCGHESSAVTTNYLLRKTGLHCKACVKISVNNTLQEQQYLHGSIVEKQGIDIVSRLLETNYSVVRTKEGCTADMLIRRINTIEDKWYNLQLKTCTKLSYGMYSFSSIKSAYSDMLLICVCVADNKLWIIPYNELNIKNKLNISIVSKYNKYLVQDNISTLLDKHLLSCKITSLEDGLTPVCELQQREQEYVLKRETCIPQLSYVYPEIQNTPTDFTVNNKRVQEKVMGVTKKQLHAFFASNNGKKLNGNRNFRTYTRSENDLYWLHSSIDNRFWVIPEKELYEREYISDDNVIMNRTIIHIPICGYTETNVWLEQYEFNYEHVNIEKLVSMFA